MDISRVFRSAAGLLAGLVLVCIAWIGGPALAQAPHQNSIAVIIGNQRYQHTTPVQYAQNDARAIEKYLIERLGFRKSNIMLRLDVGREQMETIFGEPDRADGELMDRLLDRRLENRGDIFVFYSGHGVPDPDAAQDDARRAFLLPVDVSQSRIAQAAFSIERLYKKLDLARGQLPADRKVVMMLDACFSGRTPIARGQGEGPDASIFRFSRGSFSVRSEETAAGLVRLIAATGDQVAYWDEPRRLGLFTSLFLRAVSGEADGQEFGNGDKAVTGDELARFLEERVPAEARLRHQRTQRPTLDGLERFAWTLPRPGQMTPPPIVAPLPVRAQPASLPAAPPATAPAQPAAVAPAAAAPVTPAPAAPAAAAKPQQAAVPPAAAPKPPVAPTPARAVEPDKAKPAPPAPNRTARAAPKPVVEEEDEPVRPRVRPRPRPVVDDDDEEPVRPRARPRPRPVVEPRPRPAPRVVQPAQPREPSGGGCRVVNGVRFCG